MLGFILWMVVLGLIAGAVARVLVPGEDSMGLGATILLGIVGSFVGGFLADVLFRPETTDRGLEPTGIIGSILGAVVVLFLVRMANRRGIGRRA